MNSIFEQAPMKLKDKLPVSYLLFTTRGRINRRTYWTVSVFIWATFYVLYQSLYSISAGASWAVYPLLYWALYATATKRLHDHNKRATWLLIVLIPVLGPLILFYLLALKKGSKGSNRFGSAPDSAPDYFVNPDAAHIEHLKTEERIVNDVTQLNPVMVAKVLVPETIDALQEVIRTTEQPVSTGGGRFSMGGQTASPQSIHIDMRRLNKVVEYAPQEQKIKVQAGIRWCDIQQITDRDNLSVQIMQTYANFTVGGALSVNCHGRYVGLGPVILSVLSLDVILADGRLVHTSPQKDPELFYACVGCYNAIAIIVQAELKLTENIAVQRTHRKLPRQSYADYFNAQVREDKDVIFHNGDIYPPHYCNVRAVSWRKTDKMPKEKLRLMPLASAYPIERYFIGAFSRNDFGKWRREYIIDPILYLRKKIHWRNYEAGYDVLELEPKSRKHSTYVLQEYFVPVQQFDAFTAAMSEIFKRHKVNVINVSIRHAAADSGSLLAWAREEVFAFVVWYKQGTGSVDKHKVAVWTRELIDAALHLNGSYYLPYQPHASAAQFYQAYPDAHKLFALKRQLDPGYKFRNVLWDTYYKTT